MATATADTPWYTKVGNAAQALFPSINAVRTGIAAAPVANAENGDYGRALGNVLGAAAAYPIAALNDVVGRPAAAIVHAVPGVLGGILGSTGSSSDAIPVPAVAAPAAVDPVASAMAQGRAAAGAVPLVTPQDRIGGTLAAILGRNPSIAEVQALGGLPALSQAATVATKPIQSAKDQGFGATASSIHDVFASEMAAANDLAHTDLAGAKTAAAKATDKYQSKMLDLLQPRGATADMLQQQAN